MNSPSSQSLCGAETTTLVRYSKSLLSTNVELNFVSNSFQVINKDGSQGFRYCKLYEMGCSPSTSKKRSSIYSVLTFFVSGVMLIKHSARCLF
jgi:hypothetical protein